MINHLDQMGLIMNLWKVAGPPSTETSTNYVVISTTAAFASEASTPCVGNLNQTASKQIADSDYKVSTQKSVWVYQN